MKKILYALTAALLLMYGCANEKDNNTSAAVAPDLKDDFYVLCPGMNLTRRVNIEEMGLWFER